MKIAEIFSLGGCGGHGYSDGGYGGWGGHGGSERHYSHGDYHRSSYGGGLLGILGGY
jgi:hypothetical protein